MKKKQILLFFLINCCMFCTMVIHAQTNYADIEKSVIPPSPNGASFAKYADFPIDNSTGLPQINIPLYEIKTNTGYSLPITLSYHSAGFRVDEIASWVGLGWTLNAGGMITRSIVGADDDINFNGYVRKQGQTYTRWGGYVANEVQRNWTNPYYMGSHLQDLIYLTDGTLDGDPDIYSYNFGNYSGKFIIDSEDEIHLIPDSPLKITYTRAGINTIGLKDPITSIQVVTTDGTKYTFSATERNQPMPMSQQREKLWDFINVGHNGNQIPEDNRYKFPAIIDQPYRTYNSGWYLSKIEPSNGGEIIFIYVDEIMQYVNNFNDVYDCVPDANNNSIRQWYIMRTATQNLVYGKRLSSIEWSGGKIDFIASNVYRDDVNSKSYSDIPPNYPNKGHALKEIIIKNNDNTVIKKYQLKTNYFNNPNSNSGMDYECYYRRLALRSLIETDANGNELSPYIFEYDETKIIPARYSGEIDYWGYLNRYDLGNKKTSLPEIFVYPFLNNNFNNNIFSSLRRNGAYLSWVTEPGYTMDRNSHLEYAQLAVLNKILFPSGASNTYSYELNTFEFDGNEVAGNGLRIKNIITDDGLNNSNRKNTFYTYNLDNGKTSGFISGIPEICNRKINSPSLPDQAFKLTLYASSKGDGNIVNYTQVKEDNGNGKTIYYYGDKVDYNENQVKSVYYINTLNQYCTVPENWGKDLSPSIPESESGFRKGKLLKIEQYNKSNQLVKTIENTYIYNNDNIQEKYIYGTNTHLLQLDNLMRLYVIQWDENLGYYVELINLPITEIYSGFGFYYYPKANNFLESTTVTTYNPLDLSVLTSVKTEYEYNHYHKQVIKSTQYNLNDVNTKFITTYKYTGDYYYGDVPESCVYLQMYYRNIIVPIETASFKNNILTGGIISEYQAINGTPLNKIVPYKTKKIYPSAGAGTYTPSSISLTGELIYDGRYKTEEMYDKYDIAANLIQYRNAGGNNIPLCFKWSYNSNLPNAKIVNATTNNNEQGLGTSTGFLDFEGGFQNSPNLDYWSLNWNQTVSSVDAHTGKYSYKYSGGNNNQYLIGRAFLPEIDYQHKTFVLSAWVKSYTNYQNGSGGIGYDVKDNNGNIIKWDWISFPNTQGVWKYIEIKINLDKIRQDNNILNSTNLKITSFVNYSETSSNNYFLIDDIRFCPADAQMTTYTYIPGIGVTSITDPNNLTKYFEYDNYGRLSLVKDNNNNILEKNNYNIVLPGSFYHSPARLGYTFPITLIYYGPSCYSYTWSCKQECTGQITTLYGREVTHQFSQPNAPNIGNWYEITLFIKDSNNNIIKQITQRWNIILNPNT